MRIAGATLSCLAVIAAGCGASKSPSIASLGASTGSSTTTTASNPSVQRFATCMRGHGLAADVGSAAAAPASALSIEGVTFGGNVSPTSPQFQSALQACRKDLPGGGPPTLTPAQQARWNTAMATFAACMRKHGAPSFPTPQFGKPPGGNGADLGSPLVQQAFGVCQSLEPTFGPRISIG